MVYCVLSGLLLSFYFRLICDKPDFLSRRIIIIRSRGHRSFLKSIQQSFEPDFASSKQEAAA